MHSLARPTSGTMTVSNGLWGLTQRIELAN